MASPNPYAAFAKQELSLRDQLSLDDTRMGAERTLLSYERTAIVLLASAGTLYKVFPNDRFLHLSAIVLFGISAMLGIAGIVRFLRISRLLRHLGKPGSVANSGQKRG